MFNHQKAAEEQIGREVREETMLLIKEAQQLLEKFAEFKAEQNVTANIISETNKANKESRNYFKLFTYFLFTDVNALDQIQAVANKVGDKDFVKWLRNMRQMWED